jgi:hypothetical protein
MAHGTLSVRRIATAGALVSAVVFCAVSASCQTATPATAAIALQPYTASDQSATAGVPAGWKVTSGKDTVIQMTGPQGVMLSLGNTVIARNGTFQLGQKPANGIDLSMPSTATLAQKLQMIFEQAQTLGGDPLSQFVLNSGTAIQVPASLGQCGRFVLSFTTSKGAQKAMGLFCSLPADVTGAYKNILLVAQAPAAVAAQLAPAAQAIFQSYKIPPSWMQRKLAPFAVIPAGATMPTVVGVIGAPVVGAPALPTNVSNCFDLSVLRQTPNWQLPQSCGGPRPD